jgi:hypothetical protein
MTSASDSGTPRGSRVELRVLYDEIQTLRADWVGLQTVERARAEYEDEFAKEERRLSELQRTREKLEQEKRRRAMPDVVVRDPTPIRVPTLVGRSRPAKAASQPGPESPQRLPSPEARRRLKRLVNRWAYPWNVDSVVLAQINRIADDADRPLGEAVALLDWSVFEDRTTPGESLEAHERRLAEWRDALAEYRERLEGDIASLRTRFRTSLGIWQRWRAQEHENDGREAWRTFIAETRRAKLGDITRLEGEVAALQAALGQRQEVRT